MPRTFTIVSALYSASNNGVTRRVGGHRRSPRIARFLALDVATSLRPIGAIPIENYNDLTHGATCDNRVTNRVHIERRAQQGPRDKCSWFNRLATLRPLRTSPVEHLDANLLSLWRGSRVSFERRDRVAISTYCYRRAEVRVRHRPNEVRTTLTPAGAVPIQHPGKADVVALRAVC